MQFNSEYDKYHSIALTHIMLTYFTNRNAQQKTEFFDI